MAEITWEDFEKIEIRAGTIIKAEDFPEASRPAYKIWVDFGKLGIKKASAQITKLYKKEDLHNRQVIAVTNFPAKQVANFISEVLILGVVMEGGGVVLLGPQTKVPNGYRIA
jgi:tRNA-binding protein